MTAENQLTQGEYQTYRDQLSPYEAKLIEVETRSISIRWSNTLILKPTLFGEHKLD